MKKLTTGQMIDLLGLDDVAVNQDGFKVGYDHKGDMLMWEEYKDKPQRREGNEFRVYYPWITGDLWTIKEGVND